MSTPGTRDLIRMGVIVVAGTALGVGAASQFGQSIRVRPQPVLAHMGYCRPGNTPLAVGLAYAKSEDSHTVHVTSVQVVSPGNLLVSPGFYVVDDKDDKASAGGTVLPPYPKISQPQQILPGHQVAIMVELADPHGYGTVSAIKVGLKDGNTTSLTTVPANFVMGDAKHNPLCSPTP